MQVRDHEIPTENLRWHCDPNFFNFQCTRDLSPLREFIGQERAIRAIDFGLKIANGGYNIYVAGLTGTGKTSIVKFYIEKLIKERESRGEMFKIEDWCYIYNFQDNDSPRIVNLPRAEGRKFRDAMNELLTRIKDELGKAFASEEYKAQSKNTVEEGRANQQRLFDEIAQEARQKGFAIQMTALGPALVPLKDGRPMEQQEYLELDEKTRRELEARQAELRGKLQTAFEKASNLERETAERLEQVDKQIGEFTVSRLFAPLTETYTYSEKITRYLNDLKAYTLDHLDLFKATQEQIHPLFGVPVSQVMSGRNPFLPYQVNLFIDNSEAKTIPVIVESNPNFGNMFGKIERRFVFGGYLSDHTMLKAGAMSLANGGYLLIGAREVLTNPAVWPALKRAIKSSEVRIEDPYEQFGLIAPQGMKPEPMPINVKVVLIGDAFIYQGLSMYDEDFWEIFKVKADFNHVIDRNDKNVRDYAAFLAGCCEDCKARHFDASGISRAVEYASRLVEDQEKLSTRFAQIKELVEEANYWAQQENSELITDKHVKRAIDERLFRHNLVQERIQEFIDRGIIMIDTGGTVVGQVNGLSVYSLGDISFGKPSRITAKTFMGRSGVINIERESQLSGPIHNKGVMILSGYLGWKYAQMQPLSVSASLCFEQSYEGVEGDSASSTELYAIVSSLSNVPLRQNIAVTGSVNQKGEVQPIGGVNEKIEGFFKACKAKGLTGEQGVMIPQSNTKNLMLHDDVIEAVKNGQFHIYAVKNIDEGIEVLTGVPAGERQADGNYPEGTINYLVDKCLRDMAEKMRQFRDGEREGKREESTMRAGDGRGERT